MDFPKITQVAIRFQNKIYSLPAPNRHHDIIMGIVREQKIGYVDVPEEDQGFLDATGKYLNRKQALSRAKYNKQVKDESKVRLGMLTSENLW